MLTARFVFLLLCALSVGYLFGIYGVGSTTEAVSVMPAYHYAPKVDPVGIPSARPAAWNL